MQMVLFIIFQFTLNVKMNCARNYETLLKFVYILYKLIYLAFHFCFDPVTAFPWFVTCDTQVILEVATEI